MGVIPGEEYGLPETPKVALPGEEYGLPKPPKEKEEKEEPKVPTPPSEEIRPTYKPKKKREPPTPPSEELKPPYEPKVTLPGEEFGLPGPPIPLVVGASSAEGLVIVKDPRTGETYYKPGTPEQIATVTKQLEVPEAKLPDIPYIPPSGITTAKPAPGSLAEEPKRRGPIVVYDYKGLPIELERSEASDLYELKGREQFERMVELGILQEGSEFVSGPTEDEWGYWTPLQIEAAERVAGEQVLLAKSTAELKRTHVGPLPDDKWVPISDWNKLDPKYQSIALRQGWSAAQEAWDRDRVHLPDGTWMLKSDVEHVKETMPEAHRVLVSKGFDAYSALFVNVGKDEYMLKEDYDALSEEYRKVVDDKGVTGLQKYIETGILGTTISRLDEIASPDFFRLGGSASERIALEGAMRRADIEYPGIVTYKGLSDADKQRVAESYIPPEGFGISSEAAYELGKLREKLLGWSASETPMGITTVKQLDEITSHDFTKLGWSTSDRIALENTMRRLGIKDPGATTYRKLSPEEKQEVADSFTYETLAVEVLKPAEEWTAKVVEDMTNWVTEDPNTARKIAKGIPAGLAEIVLGVTVGVGGAVLKSTNELVMERPRTAVTQLSNVPLGAAEWLLVQTPTRIEKDPIAGITLFVGNLTLPFVIPAIKGAVGGVKSGYNIAQTLYREGALPRGLKGGGLDVYRVKVPEGFERLTTELDVIARDKAQVKTIFESGLSREAQTARIRELLTPETRVVYDNYMMLINEASKFETPGSMMRVVDLGDVARIPKESAEAIKTWLQENANDVMVGGSFGVWLQSKGVRGMWKAGDLDLYVKPGGKMTPELAARQLAEIVAETSKAASREVGGKVQVAGVKSIEAHYVGEFGRLPYEWTPRPPIRIEGISVEPLGVQIFRYGEQIVNPGVGRMRGLMGPEAATRPWRLKDIHRFQTEVRGIIDTLRAQGKLEAASRLEGALDFVEKAPRGEALPLTPEKSTALQREFVDLVADLQEMALDRGIDVSVSHQLGMLHRYITPQGKVLRGTVYHAARDIEPYIRTLKEKGYIEAGRYIDEQGRWVEVTREDLFVSPDLAFDRLYDFYKGKIPKEAGVVAIRTVAGDIGRGKVVDPAFRVEYVTEKGKEPYPIVYDELRFGEGSRVYPTDPTGFSFRKGSVSEGLTGEFVTYHPRAKVPVNVIFFATEGAKKAGLGAPSAAQIHSMNLMAIKAVIGDLWHPRLPERFVATTEPIKGAALIEFRRDTYKWKGKPKEEVAKAIAEQDRTLRMEAVENLRKKGMDNLHPEEYAKVLDTELSRVASRRVMEALSDKEIQRLLKDLSVDELSRTYYYNLREIYSKLAAVGLGAAGTTDITKVTNADITALPSFASRVDAVTLPPLPFVTAVVTPVTPTEEVTPVTLMEVTEPPTAVVTPEITEPTPVTTPFTPTTPPTTPVTEIVETVTITEITTPVKPVKPVKPEARPGPLPKPEVAEDGRTRVPPGSITWRQGFVWKYIPPPWDQPKPLTLKAPPVGATLLGRTPAETIQIIGEPRAKVPREISIDLGIADIRITEYGTQIEYKGRGLETIVGERIMVPEKGMSIPVMEPAETGGIGVQGLKLGTSFAEFIRRVPEDEAQREFMEKRIAEMMPEMNVEDIVSEIKSAELPEERVAELLSHLPDKQRGIAKRILATEALYTRVGPGYQYAELRGRVAEAELAKRRRKGSKTEEDEVLGLTEEELEAKGGLKRLRKGHRNNEDILPSVMSVKGLKAL